MSTFRLVTSSPWSPLITLVMAAAVLFFALWTYRRQERVLGRRSRLVLCALRCAVVLLVAVGLLQPALSRRWTRRERLALAVLLDTSRSMSISDTVSGSRIDAGRKLLVDSDNGILRALRKNHDVSCFTFSDVLSACDPVDLRRPVAADGLLTDLGGAISAAVERAGGQRLAGVVVLSDGVRTSGPEPVSTASRLGAPVFSILLGSKRAQRGTFFDVGLRSVPDSAECIVNNRTVLEVGIGRVNLAALPAEKRKSKLAIKDGETTIHESEIVLDASDGAQVVQVPYVPATTGLKQFTASIEPLQGEPIRGNNSRAFLVNVTDPKLRVLMVEGTLRTEYKFLVRTLQSDPNVRLTSLVKTRKDRFYVREAPSGCDLSRGLPTTAEDFQRFETVVLGDISREEFDDEQLRLLRDFVETRGGGLILTGGYHAFGAGGWADSPIGALVPFEGDRETGRYVEESFLLDVTAEGKQHPVLRGCEKLFDRQLEGLKLGGCNLVERKRPGAAVLAVHPGRKCGSEAMPVILTQQFGKGRVLAVTTNTTWNWYFHLKALGRKSPYDVFWGQAVRWSAGREAEWAAAGERLSARTDRIEYEAGETVSFSARVTTEEAAPDDSASVIVEIMPPESGTPAEKDKAEGKEEAQESREIILQHMPVSGGRYQGAFVPSRVGRYTAVVRAFEAQPAGEVQRQQEPVGSVRLGFVVGRLNREFDKVDADEDAMNALAQATGGRAYTLLTAKRLPVELESRQVQVVSESEINLHNNPSLLLLLLVCLTAEWVLRKRKQLA